MWCSRSPASVVGRFLLGAFLVLLVWGPARPALAADLGLEQTTMTVLQGGKGSIGSAVLKATSDGVPDWMLLFVLDTVPAHGQLILDGSPLNAGDVFTQADIAGNLLVYEHDGSNSISDSFDFSLTDGDGPIHGSFAITITGVNKPPVFTLLDTEHIVLEDADLVSVPWLTDLSAVEEDQTVTLTVVNNNNGLFAQQPAIDPETGILTYIVAPDQYGSALVTVTATDDGGTANGGQDTTTKSFTIEVTPVNDAPTFLLSSSVAHFTSDPHPNTMSGLVYGISAGPNEAGQALRFELTVANAGRFFTDGPKITRSIYDPDHGILTLTPKATANGTATVVVRLIDDGGTENGGVDTSEAQTLLIKIWGEGPGNSAPALTEAESNTKQGVEVGQGLAALVASDPEEDPFTFAVTKGSLPPGITLEPDGTFSGLVAAGARGRYTVEITLSDGDLSSTTILEITVAAKPTGGGGGGSSNGAPWFTSPAVLNVAEDQGLPALSAIDPDGDRLTYSLLSGALPAGISLNPDGSFAGKTTFASAGRYEVTVGVRDGRGGADSLTLTIHVANLDLPPSLAAIADRESVVGDQVAFAVIGADADGDGLTYTAIGLPDGIRIDPATGWIHGELTAQSVGLRWVTVTVTDSTPGGLHGDHASRSFTWLVLPKQVVPSVEVPVSPQLSRHTAYMSGYPDGTFRPEQPLTRAEAAAVLARLFGAGEGNGAQGFTDLPADHWAAQAITLVAAQGLMTGDPDGQFRPDGSLTRAEIAAIIARVQGLATSTEAAFADTEGHWAAAQIQAVLAAGIMQGLPGHRFEPDRAVTRAEFVTAMNGVLGRKPVRSGAAPAFSDVTPTHWAFDQILEATQDHTFRSQPDGSELYVQPNP